MKRLLFLLPFFLVLLSGMRPSADAGEANEGRVRTFFSGKIERWEVSIGADEGNLEAYLMNDPNRWTFEIGSLTGEVNTEFNDTYNSWIITCGDKTYKMKTWLTNSWHKWELTGTDITGKVTIQTLYSGSWDSWTMKPDGSTDSEMDITTYYNNSWDDWNLKGDVSKLTPGEKIASVFIPVFVSRIYKRNLVR